MFRSPVPVGAPANGTATRLTSGRRAHRPLRGLASAALGLLVAGAATFAVAAPAAAASASGPDGQQLTASTTNLDPDGATVSVSGSGFDVSKGIYVALCVDNGSGVAPSPCVGGVDMEGASGTSAWISSNPPAYGEGLAIPFSGSGGGGSFSVQLRVRAADAFTDCLDPAVAPNGCVLSTRADHTRAGDRSADVRIPVAFGSGGPDAAGGSGGAAAGAEGAGAADGAAGPGSTTTTDGDLATTGVDPSTIVAAAGLLAAAGAGVLLAARRTAVARRAAVTSQSSTCPGA